MSFIRSGYSQDADDQYQQRHLNEIMTVVGVFTKDAMELASIYCLHARRNSVTRQDVELALKTRAYHGDTFWNRGDIQQKLIEMKQFLNEPGSDSEYESDYDYDENEEEGEMSDLPDDIEDIEDTEDIEDIEENFIKSECTCDLCTTLNGIQEKWNTWNPYERMELSIKNSINQTFSKY